MRKKVFSVSEINGYIKSLLESDFILSDIFVEAEISNFKLHSSGHMYFTLKDDYASISAVMFKGVAMSLKFMPKNGMKVIVYGRVSIYEKTGQYQIYVDVMEPSGTGALFTAFTQLKDRLEKEGLFKEENKKKIPLFPKAITLITSPTGAVLQDMVRVIQRRNKTVKIYIYPVHVQGDLAPYEISTAINEVNKLNICDTIILARGGGSIEDLWAFNEEIVARAIFESKIPIISAVGHETDFTIADFVADFRASTPSVAGEISVQEVSELINIVKTYSSLLENSINNKLLLKRTKLDYILKSNTLQNPLIDIYNKQIYIDNLTDKLEKEMNHLLQTKKQSLEMKISLLHSLSPLNVLNRGYAVPYDKNYKVIKSVEQIKEKDSISILLKDGEIKAEIIECNINERIFSYGKKETNI